MKTAHLVICLALASCSGEQPVPDAPGDGAPPAGDIRPGAETSQTTDAPPGPPPDVIPTADGAPPKDLNASPDAGSGPGEDCKAYPFKSATLYAERAGFGGKVSGGDPAKVFHVKTLKDSGSTSLRAALESSSPYWVVFDVQGTIKLSSTIEIKSNKTIDGRGRAITIHGPLRLSKGTKNVVITDVAVTNPKGDAIEIRGDTTDSKSAISTRGFWFHHLELYSSGDGLIDIWHAATEITISWCHLHTHLKALLVAANGDYPAVDSGIRVTYHHNHFDRITRRGPRLRFGLGDFYNNYQDRWYEYGAGSFSGAQLLSEGNIYEARPGTICLPPCPDPNPGGDNDVIVSKKALIVDWAGLGQGYTRSVGDQKLNGAQLVVNQPTKVFSRASYYQASVEPAGAALKQKILAGAGPRTGYCQGP